MSHLWFGIRCLLEVPYGCLEVVVLERGLSGVKMLQSAQHLNGIANA